MKNFLKKIIYFIIPFLLYYVLIYFMDPFNYYNKKNDLKGVNLIAKKTEPHLYKLIDFKHNPKKNILLGDSRTNGLFGVFEENKQQNWSNLAYGGASLNEVIETFWHVTKTEKIDSVVIGINFNHFNTNNTRNWIHPSLSLMENPISYSYSKYVYLSILESIQESNVKNETKDNLSKNIFWTDHLNMIKNKYYTNVIFPEKYLEELRQISTFCEANNINLIFWIAPVHQDIHDIIKKNGYSKDYNKFIDEIGGLSTFYNFDDNVKQRMDKSNFKDAMHVNELILQNIHNKIFNE